MIGFFKSGCDQLCCIEKFRSCKMKNDNIIQCSCSVNAKARSAYTILFKHILSLSEIVVCARWRNWRDWRDCNAVCRDGEEECKRTCTNPTPSKSRLGVQDPEKKRGRVILDRSTVGKKDFWVVCSLSLSNLVYPITGNDLASTNTGVENTRTHVKDLKSCQCGFFI